MQKIADFWIISRARRVCVAGVAAIMLSACGGGSGDEPAEAPQPETDGTTASVEDVQPGETEAPVYASWELNIGETSYQGELFKHYTLDGDPMIHLINRGAINFTLAFEGEPSGERPLSTASFTNGRGPTCWRVGPETLSTVRFEEAHPGWLSGQFSATLGCPDASLMEVEGVFHINAPGEE